MLNDNIMSGYFDRLINRVFKILPLKEKKEDTIHAYTDSLLSEMLGVEIVSGLTDQPNWVSVIGIVSYLNANIDECDKDKVKKEVFQAINLCQKLRDSYAEGGGSNVGA